MMVVCIFRGLCARTSAVFVHQIVISGAPCCYPVVFLYVRLHLAEDKKGKSMFDTSKIPDIWDNHYYDLITHRLVPCLQKVIMYVSA